MGYFPADHFSSQQMISYCGEVTNSKGNQFSEEVRILFEELHFHARNNVEMTEFLAPAGLGDVDVLAWDTNRSVVVAVECKRLRPDITVHEIAERLQEFAGDKDDSLGKHVRRILWLKANLDQVGRVTGILTTFVFHSLLVTNSLVPMQFREGLPIPTDDIVSFSDLRDHIRRLWGTA